MKVEHQSAIELSHAELDVIAGGADLFPDITQFQSEILAVGQHTQSIPDSSTTAANNARQKINSRAAHLIAGAS